MGSSRPSRPEKRKRTLIDLYRQLPLAKPKSTRKQERIDHKKEESVVIRTTRQMVWRRSRVCEVCGDTERESAMRPDNGGKSEHEMHELISRARTRGQPSHVRFNVTNCIRACARCHRLFTDNVIAMQIDNHSRIYTPWAAPRLSDELGPLYQVPVGQGQIVAICVAWRLLGGRVDDEEWYASLMPS